MDTIQLLHLYPLMFTSLIYSLSLAGAVLGIGKLCYSLQPGLHGFATLGAMFVMKLSLKRLIVNFQISFLFSLFSSTE